VITWILLSCAVEKPTTVDTIFYNGNIQISHDQTQSEIGIRDGKFVTVDDNTVASKEIDLQGKTMWPGFHDSHTHMLAGSFIFDRLLMVGVSNMSTIINKVASYVEDNPDISWIVGYGWVLSMMEDPSGVALDEVSSNIPLAIFDSSGHALLVNSVAMELAGIDANTPDPPGGEIKRDEDGNPIGVLLESAIELVSPMMISQFTDEDLAANLEETIADFHAAGVTSISEILAVPGVTLNRPQLYTNQPDLNLRVHYFVPIFSEDDLIDLESQVHLQTDMVRFVGGKIWVDGSIGSGEAWSLEASVTDDTHFGSHYFNEEQLQTFITHAETYEYSLKFHVNGDAAVHATLNALEIVEQELGALKQTYTFDHVVLISLEDYGRMNRLGIIASVQPSHSLVGQFGMQADHWNDARADQIWDFQTIAEAGIPIALGTDWPVWPTPDAMVNYWTTVEGVGERSLTKSEAMAGYTQIGALAVDYADLIGSIEQGKWADFVLLSDDPYSSDHLSDITIEETWVAGNKVFQK
jgi:predicted amidohydrolase YtcJ